jgi:eukaryotic-like serine/threonine-protein kinase
MPALPSSTIDHLRKVLGPPDLSGTKYRHIEKIASGGMGEVFLVEDRSLKRKVALKVVHGHISSKEFTRRLSREAEIIARLEHPGIVPIHDVGTLADGRSFYTMKYVQGQRLDEFVPSSPSLSDLLRVFQRICEAVSFAHSHGVIHRDLKPENIMVGQFGEVLVMDWGVAKVVGQEQDQDRSFVPGSEPPSIDSSGTQPGTIVGTLAYMSPEQAAGKSNSVGTETDIYSLGAILYFILTGRPPFDIGTAEEIRRKILETSPTPPRRLNPKVSRTIEAITFKAMARAAEARYTSAQLLSADVAQFLDGLPVSAYRENPLELLDRWVNRNRFLILLILAYILVRLAIFFFAGR